jgi:hypothetical protein
VGFGEQGGGWADDTAWGEEEEGTWRIIVRAVTG